MSKLSDFKLNYENMPLFKKASKQKPQLNSVRRANTTILFTVWLFCKVAERKKVVLTLQEIERVSNSLKHNRAKRKKMQNE